MTDFQSIADDVTLGSNVRLARFINLYGCSVGDNTGIGAFVEIQKNARIGSNCKIQSHTFVCEGVIIEDNVFVGHAVTFINDRFPRAVNSDGSVQTEKDWQVRQTLVQEGASIGSGATIMCGVTIGKGALIGAGSMVLHDVPAHTISAGNPATTIRSVYE